MLEPSHSTRTVRTMTLLVLAFLAGCAVGPAYVRPKVPSVKGYTARAEPLQSRNHAHVPTQRFQYGAGPGSGWWQGFHSKLIDSLIDQALRDNPGLHAEEATLEEAHYALRADQGIFFPQVSLGLSGERNRPSGATSGGVFHPPIFNLYTGQVSVSYYPDIFGLNHLLTDQGRAEEAVAQDELDAARLTLEGNVLNTLFDWIALRQEVAAQSRTIHDQRTLLSLAVKRYRLGADSELDVLTQQTELASSEAALPPLESARDQAAHLLAIYLGEFPAQALPLGQMGFRTIHLPRHLPVALPSDLVRIRPDILAAEAQLRAANAVVGQRVAAMYPLVELTAGGGVESNSWRNLFLSASRIWDIGAALTMPIFDGGTLEAEKQEAVQSYRALFADYQATVLNAFANVADTLRALEHDSSTLAAQARALNAAERAFHLVQVEYRSGAVNYLSVLASETALENARIGYVEAQAGRYTDTVALYVALGGSRLPVAPHHPSSQSHASEEVRP
ncbi:MAG: efflux transporter outer membrane subunit [Gammaproteobacteria bacterium]